MSALGDTRSLGWRVVAGLLLVEIIFGIVLGAVVSLFWAISIVQQHRQATEQTAQVLAASLMPMIADQQESRLRVELETLVHSSGLEGVHCIHVLDSSGQMIASHGDEDVDVHEEAQVPSDIRSLLFESSLVRESVVIDGLEIASVYVMFDPPDLSELIGPSALIWGVVLVAVILVSVPWTLWVVARDIVEPIGDIERYAESVAEGAYETAFELQGVGEIGRLQGTLGRMASQLEQRQRDLGDSYRALSEAYLSLEQANRDIERLASVKSDFVAVAAHEIRAPLATIRLYAEMLEAGEMGTLEEAGDRAVAAIHAAAVRLGSIASDLMDSALLERGLLPIQISTLLFGEVVREAVSDAQPAAAAREIDMTLEDAASGSMVPGDPLRLRQVLDNLLSNAIKYSPEGSTIAVEVARDGEWVTCSVTDQGRGIADSDRDRLFTLFGRIDFGDSRHAAGLGLGLAISARIVAAHGGTVSYGANPEGPGSVFTVRLPAGGQAEGAPVRTSVRVVDGGEGEDG